MGGGVVHWIPIVPRHWTKAFTLRNLHRASAMGNLGSATEFAKFGEEKRFHVRRRMRLLVQSGYNYIIGLMSFLG